MTHEEMIDQTKRLLEDLGMDSERSNERSAMVFLALAHLDETMRWDEATGDMYTTRQIMNWISDHLGTTYAPNTRETIRRFTLHQFVAGGIAEQNADRHDRPINSPTWNYRIVPSLLPAIKSIGTLQYQNLISKFKDGIETWKTQQLECREISKIPVTMPDGTIVKLSAGGQNILIQEIVEEFCPRFSPAGRVLYIDDTDKRKRTYDTEALESIGIILPEHGKAPDLIVWMEDRQWLFLIEACSTHGPIDVMRKRELSQIFEEVDAHPIYVSCFPDRATMRGYLVDLAWETEAWCAEDPDHMIHLDGEKFLGPY